MGNRHTHRWLQRVSLATDRCINRINGTSGQRVSFGMERPDLLDVWHGCRARAKHKAFPELRNARSGHRAHVSDKFRRDRFEASTTPTLLLEGPEGARGDGGRVGAEGTGEFPLGSAEERKSRSACWGGEEEGAGHFDHNC